MDEMVPKDHLLRIIDKAIDWTFIYDLVKDKYSHDTGRPSMDPVTLIKNTSHSVSVWNQEHASDSKKKLK